MARILDKGISKLYYTISEVCELVDEEAHVLRYWESEFSELKPKKNRAGKRTYTKDDIGTVRRIRRLLRGDKYTIEGARQAMKQEKNGSNSTGGGAEDLLAVRKLLVDMKDRIQ